MPDAVVRFADADPGDGSADTNISMVVAAALTFCGMPANYTAFKRFVIDMAMRDEPQPELAAWMARLEPEHFAWLVGKLRTPGE
jgi:hypothetical protein